MAAMVLNSPRAVEMSVYVVPRILRNRGAFPDDASVSKLLYLAIMRASKRWTHPVTDWGGTLNRFALLFPDRININASYTRI